MRSSRKPQLSPGARAPASSRKLFITIITLLFSRKMSIGSSDEFRDCLVTEPEFPSGFFGDGRDFVESVMARLLRQIRGAVNSQGKHIGGFIHALASMFNRRFTRRNHRRH